MNMRTNVALPVAVPEMGTQKIWPVPGYAHGSLFSQIFNGLLLGRTL